MISGHGFSNAKVMLIGDTGSDEDNNTGLALSGYTKTLLGHFCRDNGLNVDEMWLTLFIKERGSQKKFEENEDLVSDHYREILVNEIKEIRPNIICPLNELSFRYTTGHQGIRKFRGSVLPARFDLFGFPLRAIPILGPNPFLNEDHKLRFITRLDFGKVARNVEKTGLIEEVGHVWVAKSSEQVRQFFSRHYRKADYVVFDIETYCDLPTCISFCFDGNESCTIPILDWNISQDTRVMMLREVMTLLASPLPKVNQNIKFDWKKLERLGIKVENVQGDTLLAASCLYAEFPKNLGFLTSLYTDMPYFKDEGKQFDPSIHNRDRLYLYCAKDSLATHQIYREQQKELVELGVDKVYRNIIEILPLYKKAEENGLRIDLSRRSQLLDKYETLFNIQLYKLQLLCGEPINPLSPTQVSRIVYEELEYKRVRGVKSNKSGGLSTDEESLELLAWIGHHKGTREGKEILRTIVNCRKIHKIIEILELDLHPDERMRNEFKLGGTENGRTSASSTTDNLIKIVKNKLKAVDLGHSFQTIGKHGFEMDGEELGKDVRSMYVPSRGYSFVECDLSQAEARVDAVLAKDFDILSVFDGPVGIHRLTGSWLFGCAPEDIKKGTRQYHEAKIARHAGERNMTAERLLMMIHQEINVCNNILRTLHDNQPNIRQVFHREIRYEVQNKKCLVAPNGRRRDFYGRFDEPQVNEAISFLPQAIVSDQLKFSLRATYDKCDYARPLVEAHDGFLGEVPIGREREYAEEFKKNVEKPIDFRTCTLSREFELVIPMEAESSNENWQLLKKLEI